MTLFVSKKMLEHPIYRFDNFLTKIQLKPRKNNGVLIAAKKLYFIVAGIRLIVIILVSKVIGQCIWRHAPRGRHNKGGQHSHT